MTWLKQFFILKPSSVFITLFGIITGLIGYKFNQLPAKLYDSDKIIYSFILGTSTIMGCLKWINFIVGKEIETELKIREIKLEQEFSEKVETKISSFMNDYSRDIECLKKEIDSLDILTQKREEILKSFYHLESAHKTYKYKSKSAKKISNWLAVRENTNILQKVAIDAVKISNFSIDKQYLYEFKKDIKQCIIWLRYSVKDRQAYLYQPERQTSAMIKSSHELLEAYRIAFNAIQKYIHNEFKDDAVIVKEMLEYIINQITAFISIHN